VSNIGIILKYGLGVGHSRSLDMAPFDRSHTSSYSSSVVTVAIYCIVSEIMRDVGPTKKLIFIPFSFNL